MKFDMYFSKICRENSIKLKFDENKRVLYMKTNTHFYYILLRMIFFQEKIIHKIETHILYSIFFPPKSCRLWDNVEKILYSRAGYRWHECALQAGFQRHRYALRLYNKYCFSTATAVARTRLNYVILAFLVSFILSSTFFPNNNKKRPHKCLLTKLLGQT
jgi:hypothetical protein